MRSVFCLFAVLLATFLPARADLPAEWRTIPLIEGDKVAPDWVQVGYGRMVVDNGSIRTECDARGLGLLLYTKEKLGNCQLRIVYRAENDKSNSGVFIRIGDGALKAVKHEVPPAERTAEGKLTDEGAKKLQEASARELGPWYAVHNGFEVQICDGADERHRTGAVYSLSRAAPAPRKADGEWRTMRITLDGTKVTVEVDGERVSEFDSARIEPAKDRQWYEPRRDRQRPESGYFGLQTHDPGDVVWFKEVSVRSLK
jgi:hypothetical protein